MIDVNKITSTLAKLPDAQLQQYAQMHKNDPYIMALAMTESNRRKELRAAAQGQAPQEQPKVVDQAVAEMAPQQMPEEMGIGRLPAGEMEFANGGIVAFADGGDVERYQFGGTTGNIYDAAKARAAEAQQKLYSYGLRQRQLDPAGFEAAQQEVAAAKEVLRNAKQNYEQDFSAAGLNQPAFGAPTKAAAAFQEPPVVSAAAQDPTSSSPIPTAASNRDLLNRAEQAASKNSGTASAAPQVKAPSPSNVERAEALSSPTTLDALQQKYFGDIDSQQATFKTMREGLVKGMKDVALANWEQDKKDAEERSSDKVYKSREERLAKQEKDMEGMGDRYLGLALLQAGAAMMSTPGGIGAALGKGISVGADRYAAGLDKINAAQAKFAEARDRLDELRINRDDMSAKQIRESFREYKAAELKGQEFLLSTLEKDFGIKRDVMGKMFTAAADDLQTTRRIAAQKATAGKQDTNEQMKAALFADLKNKYPNDPTRVATEFNKAIAKASADPTALYNQELAKQLAEEQVKMAKMGNVALPGQKEKIQALQNQLFGGGGNQAKVASRDDVAATAKASGKTEQQVIEALKARGYTIQ